MDQAAAQDLAGLRELPDTWTRSNGVALLREKAIACINALLVGVPL
ncbi:hypothetical protein [Noviherbaspirillum sp. Root189]|nr:hypothetical protein [Noviherbaspirillum sp. Root189]